MNFNSKTKVKNIALSNPAAKRVLEDAGLDYCCGGGKSLHEGCLHADVSPEEILNRLQENSKDVSPEEASWTSAPLSDLTRHIRERHHRYVREAIARVQPLLDKVETKHGKSHTEIADIRKLFARSCARDDHAHAERGTDSLPIHRRRTPFFETVRNPIQAMIKEHDAAGELVKQIRKASLEYTTPADACTSYRALYQDLKEFEADLHLHVHLENNVLFPRLVEVEAAIT